MNTQHAPDSWWPGNPTTELSLVNVHAKVANRDFNQSPEHDLGMAHNLQWLDRLITNPRATSKMHWIIDFSMLIHFDTQKTKTPENGATTVSGIARQTSFRTRYFVWIPGILYEFRVLKTYGFPESWQFWKYNSCIITIQGGLGIWNFRLPFTVTDGNRKTHF